MNLGGIDETLGKSSYVKNWKLHEYVALFRRPVWLKVNESLEVKINN